MSELLERAQEIGDQIVAWRRDFHAHPELSFQETRTAARVAETLEALGIDVQTGVAKTGVVGNLGAGAPTIAIRADMDALPIHQQSDEPYRSQTDGVMHACGHDAHTAMLLGAARILSELPNRPAGTVRFLFQPSEEAADDENKSGGRRMAEEGALDDVDAVIALHVDSASEPSSVTVGAGPATAAEDSFFITLTGTGGHGAFPHQGSDPVFILAQVINAINGIRARRIDPTRPAALSIGAVHGGHVTNVIPSEIEIKGTIRTFDEETRAQMREELEAALGVARALGGDFDLRFRTGYPSLHNDEAVTETIRSAARAIGGDDSLLPHKAMMGAEDFSFMAQKAPGAMFMLGAKKDDVNRPHHTPVFDIDESALPVGTAILCEATLRLLREHA